MHRKKAWPRIKRKWFENMASIEVEQAQANLPTLIQRLGPNDEVTITENGVPVARLTCASAEPPYKRIPGLWKSMAVILSDDNEHLKEFRDLVE